MLHEPKPVQHIEVSEKHVGLRIVLFLVAVIVGVAGIGWGIYYLTKTETGWSVVSPTSAAEQYAQEYTLYYYFEGRSVVKNSRYRAVVQAYGNACYEAYRQFNVYEGYDDVHNVYYINAHPNEDIEVDAVLYGAFEKVAASGSRVIYGAPVQAYFDATCTSDNDWMALEYDPVKNDEVRAFALKALTYVRDAESVNVRLLGDNKLRLEVSEAYLAFAKENEIDVLVDFGYLRNAFALDYIADTMLAEGYGDAILSSYDGYCRSTAADTAFNVNVISRVDDNYRIAAVGTYSGRQATVSWASFGSVGDASLHYEYADGSTTHVYYDLADGKSKCATVNLIGYSKNKGCADVALALLPIWVADDLDADALWALADSGIYGLYTDAQNVLYNDASLKVTASDGFEATDVTQETQTE